MHGKVMVKASLEHENHAELEAQGDIDFERQTSVGTLDITTGLFRT